MNPRPGSDRFPAARGFTLIEVMIALVVVALGIGALLTTLTSSAETIGRLRVQSFAQWVALNRISEVRLSGERPATGTRDGEAEFGGARWRWHQQVSDAGFAGMLRIEVAVQRLPASGAPAVGADIGSFPALASVSGFLGSAVAPPRGIDPDWSLAGIAGTGGDGGSDTGKDGDTDAATPEESRQ
jgi:general secretion pathway protein I